MAKRHFLELARQGEPEAIATLINRNLHPKGITALVSYELGYLQISLEAEQLPRRGALLNFIKAGLTRLDVAGVRMVRVYGHCKGRTQGGWQDSFTLQDDPPRLNPLDVPQDALKRLARQGDEEAIACLLNEALAHKHWSVAVTIKDQCLKVNIYGETPPQAAIAVTLATRLIAKIRSHLFNRVEIRGYGTQPALLQWLDCFDNEDQKILAKTTIPPKSTLSVHAKTTSKHRPMLMDKIKTWF